MSNQIVSPHNTNSSNYINMEANSTNDKDSINSDQQDSDTLNQKQYSHSYSLPVINHNDITHQLIHDNQLNNQNENSVPLESNQTTSSISSSSSSDTSLSSPSASSTFPYTAWSYIVRAGWGVVFVLDYVGETLADFFGITSSRYQYVIDAHNRHVREIEMEKEEEIEKRNSQKEQELKNNVVESELINQQNINLEEGKSEQ